MDDGTLHRTDDKDELDKIYHIPTPNNEKVVESDKDNTYNTCVLLESGDVACMGTYYYNRYGQLGVGEVGSDVLIFMYHS